MSKIFALVDCNNFFVSCERVFRPDLQNAPVVVLSNNDGCVVARSNEVKELGVPMGAPHFTVKNLFELNGVKVFSANFSLYGDFSQRVVKILQDHCPEVEVYSVDESFLEISKLPINNLQQWGRDLRAKILKWTGLPVSVGIAPNKTLAKAAADYVKKHDHLNGALSVVDDEEKRQMLIKWLPIKDVWGIGRANTPKLMNFGIKNAYDLCGVTDAWALKTLNITGLKTVRELRGDVCFDLLQNNEAQKSISRTRSFGHSIRDYYQIEGAVATFAAQAAAKLRQQQQLAGAILTFVRTSKHAKILHGASCVANLHPFTSDTGAIIAAALKNLQQIYDPEFGYKKAGVVLLNLTSQTQRQLAFGDCAAEIDKKASLMQSVDELNKRYGLRLVRHASEHVEARKWQSLSGYRSKNYTTNWLELAKVKAG